MAVLAGESAPSSAPTPRGITWGHLAFLPSGKLDFTYSDNALRTGRNTVQDNLWEFAPAAEMRFQPDETTRLSVLYEFGWHDYEKNTARDYLSHRAEGEARITNALISGLSFTLGDKYNQTANTSALENQVLAFTRLQGNQTYGKVEYEFNRFSVSGKYAFGFQDYFARANAGSDYSTHGGDLEGAYKFLPGPRLTLFGRYAILRTLWALSDVTDFDTHTLMVGVRGSYSKLTYSVGLGYGLADSYNLGRTADGPSFDASLAYTPHERITAGVAASRRFVAGVITGVSTDTNLSAALTVVLTQRGKFTLGYTRNESVYQTGQTQLSLAYNAAFEYKLARFAAVSVGYTRYEREVSTGGGGFVINEGHAGVRLAW